MKWYACPINVYLYCTLLNDKHAMNYLFHCFKGVQYEVKEQNFMEIIRRPQGSGGYYRYQHGSRLLVGARAAMEYFDTVFGNSREQQTYFGLFSVFVLDGVFMSLRTQT